MKLTFRYLVLIAFTLLFWQVAIHFWHIPDYFLPSPLIVLATLKNQVLLLSKNAVVTLAEAILGLLLSILIGAFAAIIAFRLKVVGYLLLPLLIISQALPTFAIAPLLVLWLGYGLASKVVLIIIMLFFPVTASLLEGLRRVEPLWMMTAALMTSKHWQILWQIQLPAALPYFAAGIRIATAGAMMGAIIGEWVGASQGLGFLLLEANARLETNLVFASLMIIIMFSLLLYKCVDYLLKRLITW